jgi:hypothetical protein
LVHDRFSVLGSTPRRLPGGDVNPALEKEFRPAGVQIPLIRPHRLKYRQRSVIAPP